MNSTSTDRNVKTVLELDLASYSDIARVLEENLDVHAVKVFEDQVQSFVDIGLSQVDIRREDVVLGSAGDNAILVFDDAIVMYRFAEAVQHAVAVHNVKKSVESAKRYFRMGAATGPVLVIQEERRIVGTTVARAVRLEAAAKNGELLIDSATFESLQQGIKAVFGAEEIISGKREERFLARRCTFLPKQSHTQDSPAPPNYPLPMTSSIVPPTPSMLGQSFRALWNFATYVCAGGKARWFRVNSQWLAETCEATSPGEREAQLFGRVIEVGLSVAPEDNLEQFRLLAPRLSNEQFALAFPADRIARLQRFAVSPTVAAVRVTLAIGERVVALPLRDSSARHLAGLLAASGSIGAFIAHLEQCRLYGLSTVDFLASLLKERMERKGWEVDPAWEMFFAQVPVESIPPIFEVHHALGRLHDCIRLAKSRSQQQAALEMCVNSPRTEEIALGLDLARKLGQDALERRVHNALGDSHARANQWALALPHYEAGQNFAAQSLCHEYVGDYQRALSCCPAEDRERQIKLFDRCVELALDSVRRMDLKTTLAYFMFLRKLSASEGDDADWKARHGAVERHRLELLDIARQRFARDVNEQDPERRRSHFLVWAEFEEQAEEFAEAAVRLEQTGDPVDRMRASHFWERDERYGEAVRTLGPLAQRSDVQVRVAHLRQSGGDHLGAAGVFVHLNRFEDAMKAFEAGGAFGSAADCLERTLGDGALHSFEYARLLALADRTDELVAAWVDRIEKGAADGAEYLRRIVQDHKDTIRSPALLERASALLTSTVCKETRRRFDERIDAWIEQAKAAVRARFATIWGMDLGTSKCAVSIYDLQDKRAVVCPHHGRPHFASTLAVDDRGNELVGLDSHELFRQDLLGAIERSKRQMGTAKRFKIRDQEYRPEQVAARFIAHGRSLVEGFLHKQIRAYIETAFRSATGENLPGEWLEDPAILNRTNLPMQRAIITIPAYFDYVQRRATRDAAEIAGIDLVRLIPEPTSACFSLNMAKNLSGQVLVVDLGAGTTDLSYLNIGGGLFEVENIFGDSQFGSSDLDQCLTEHFSKKLAHDGVGPQAGLDQRRLRAAVEQLKVQLSDSASATFDLVAFAGRDRVTLQLTAEEFETIIEPQLRRLEAICQPVQKLKKDRLLLVGAPMRSPLIRKRIEKTVGLSASYLEDPRTAVAIGAGYNAGYLSNPREVDLLLLDIVPFSLGVITQKDKAAKTERVTFHIRRETKIPCEVKNIYSTAEDNQPAVSIRIMYGLGDSDEPAANKHLAVFDLTDIPPAKAGEPQIEVAFDVDANGVLNVLAKNLKTGKSASTIIKDAIWSTKIELAAMRAQLEDADRARKKRERLEKLMVRASSTAQVLESIQNDRPDVSWKNQFQSMSRQLTSTALAADQQSALAEMFNQGPMLCDQFILKLDSAGNSARVCKDFHATLANLDVAGKNLEDLINAGEQLVTRAEEILDDVRKLSIRLRQWSQILTELAISTGDPHVRLVAAHEVGAWAHVISAYEQAFANGAQVEASSHEVLRCLDALARLGDRERYRQLLSAQAGRVGARTISFDRINEFCRFVKPTLAWVAVDALGTGSGFLVSDRHVVTNRHVVTVNGAVAPTGAAWALVGGERRKIRNMRFPGNPEVDLAVLELEAPMKVPAVRVGFSRLVEIGEKVLALGFPQPEGDSFEENLLADHGVVNRIRSRPHGPEFELGLRIQPGMSGGPVFNDHGEVIGVITFARFVSQKVSGEVMVVDKSAHAIGVEALFELLPPAWRT